MITADQLVAHLVGDYILQSDWMALEKTKKSVAAAAHAVVYTLPFVFITQSPGALITICGTHFIIDRWRLARFVVWAKNYLAPPKWHYKWSECVGTGYHKSRPEWIAVWLLIIADNTMHIIINGVAIRWL